MGSPCISFVRCRVKDLTSCFYACRFPLDEESSDIVSTTFPQMQNQNMAANSRSCSSKTRDSVSNKIRNEEEKQESSAQISILNSATYNDNEVEEGSRDPKWPRFSEEDYIVFCFREDGAIHMINESKPSKTHDDDDKKVSSSHVCTPLGELEAIGDFDMYFIDHVVYDDDDQEEEEWSNEMESDWPGGETKEIDSATIGTKGFEQDSFESCDSTQSDSTTNSFSFPKLGMEWIGSPVHMPKSEKHKATSVLLHCCRF